MPAPVPWHILRSAYGGHDCGPLSLPTKSHLSTGRPAAAATPTARPIQRSFVQAVASRADFAALLDRLGVLGHWDEIVERNVTVRVLGSVFDREGYPVGSVPPYPEDEELTVCFYKEDVYLGAILLADLCRLAAVTPDAVLPIGR